MPNFARKKFMKLSKKISITFLALTLLYIGTGCETSAVATSQRVQYSNPTWAPAYSSGVRYYYMPDIEAYYDLSNRDFVYLNKGQWLFSNDLPPIYSDYDLNYGFTIALNNGVYEPWMHHQYYVSNYPRYYYRNVYKNYDNDGIRGFNENEHKPYYKNSDDRNKTYGVRPNDRPKEMPNRNDDAHRNAPPLTTPQQTPQRNEDTHRNSPTQNPSKTDDSHINMPQRNQPSFSRDPQKTNYYGKNIGQPVIVRPNMRENRPPIRQQTVPQNKPQIPKGKN